MTIPNWLVRQGCNSTIKHATWLFHSLSKMVVQAVRRRRSWPSGDFPMGPTRAQLREVSLCLNNFARSVNVPIRIRRHTNAVPYRSIHLVREPVMRMEFYMLRGIVVSIKVRYLCNTFRHRFAYEVLINGRRMPLRFTITWCTETKTAIFIATHIKEILSTANA
jgi:hypothetical protein